MEEQVRQAIKTVEGGVNSFWIETEGTARFPSGIKLAVENHGVHPAWSTLSENRYPPRLTCEEDKFELEIRPGDEIAFSFDDKRQGDVFRLGTLYRDGQPYAA